MTHAEMAELADALDSGSSEHYAHAGSSPVFRTKHLTLDDTIRIIEGCFCFNNIVFLKKTICQKDEF